MYKEKETNSVKKLDVSSVTLKNWVGLKNTSSIIEELLPSQISSYNVQENPVKKYFDDSDYSTESEIANTTKDLNYSYAHCLHQSIETLAQSLNEKIDLLQNTQIDIHHIEIITDRVFHNIEKLRNEIRASNSYIQSLENKNRGLESKIDVLLLQNELIMQKYSKLELLCERFFSKNSDIENLENKVLVLESKFSHSKSFGYDTEVKRQEEKIPENEDKNVYFEEYYDEKPELHNNNEENHGLLDELYPQQDRVIQDEDDYEVDLEMLHNSKKQVEEFMKNNYPKDYHKFKKYSKKPLWKWLNKIFRLN